MISDSPTGYNFYYSIVPYTQKIATDDLGEVDSSNFTLEVQVSVSEIGAGIDNVTIHYFTPTENLITMENQGSYWNGTIPATLEDYVTFHVITYDLAGNWDKWDNNGTDFSYKKPEIKAQPLIAIINDDISEKGKIQENGFLDLSLSFYQDEEFVENVTFWYRLDDGEWTPLLMSYNQSNKIYNLIFSDLEGYLQFEYYIQYFDKKGEATNITDKVQSLEIVPLFPQASSDLFSIIILIIGSSVVGTVMISLHSKYSKEYKENVGESVKKQKRDVFGAQKKQFTNEVELIKEISRILPDEKKFLNQNYILSLTGFLGIFALALLADFVFNLLFEIVLFLYIGAMLMSLVVFIYWIQRDVNISIKNEKIKVGNILFGITNVALFIIVTLFMFTRGVDSNWFNYHIINQGGQPPLEILGFAVPTVYIKILSTYLTSFLVVYLTTIFEIRKYINDINKIYEKKANVYVTMFQKEEYIKRIDQRMYIKVIIFLFLIGLAVIPFSAAGIETLIVGVYLVVPFAIIVGGYAIVRLLGEALSKKDTETYIIDKTKTCNSCGKETLFEGMFCLHCGANFAHEGIYIENIVSCAHCGSIIPKDSLYCKECGKKNTENTKIED